MAKLIAKYEVLYILDPALGDESTAALVKKFQDLVQTEEGTILSTDEWGKRRLAYPINDLNEGYYVLMTFEAKPELPQEMDRVMKITDGVVRSLIICKEE
jgi:small subunit ribosomal protein S6